MTKYEKSLRCVASRDLGRSATALPWHLVSALAVMASCAQLAHGQAQRFQVAGTIGTLPGAAWTIPNAINNDGLVVGETRGPSSSRAFVWSLSGGIRDIGGLIYRTDSVATGINDAGHVVGYSSGGGYGTSGFIWSESLGIRNWNNLVGAYDCFPQSINDQGQIIGSFFASAPSYTHFVWSQDNGMVDLGGPIGNSAGLYPRDINNLGEVTGWEFIGGITGPRAFVWSETIGKVSLGLLPGADSSLAYSINSQGFVVGQSEFIQDGGWGLRRAFVWSQSMGMQDLNGLVANPTALDSLLAEARGISDNGQIVAISQNGTAYLLVAIPEPMEVMGMVSAVLLVVGVSRRLRGSAESNSAKPG